MSDQALGVKGKMGQAFIKGFRVPVTEIYFGGQEKTSEVFSVGDIVAVTGVSKGKGFAGGVKRWHWKGGPKTHGQSDRQRAPGSIGSTTTPGRVFKGKHMAGRMGGKTVTTKGLHIVSVDSEKKLLAVSGAVPGRFGGDVKIKKISSGSLEELEHKTVVQVVEGEVAPTAESTKEEVKS
jgi:large subunit ribosomal protein L3